MVISLLSESLGDAVVTFVFAIIQYEPTTFGLSVIYGFWRAYP